MGLEAQSVSQKSEKVQFITSQKMVRIRWSPHEPGSYIMEIVSKPKLQNVQTISASDNFK